MGNKQTEFKKKLNKAFSALRKIGFFAKQNYLCCASCGWYNAGNAIKANPGKYSAVVFYHSQDAEGLKDDEPSLYLAHGAAVDVKDTTEEHRQMIGKTVVKVMKEAGLAVEWEGCGNKRIGVSLPKLN
jgi:hypothetical protein